MSLTESKQVDKIEVINLGQISVREATTIMRDGEEIAKTYHRWTFAPGDDVSFMPANVQAIAAVVWTPEVIAAYQARMAQHEAEIGAQA